MNNPFKTSLLLITLFLTSSTLIQANTLVDFKDIDLKEAAVSGKKIFVSFTAKWCAPCQVMDESIFNDTEISEILNDNFVAIKADLDTESGNEWNDLYNANFLPTSLFALPDGKEIDRLKAVPTRDAFMDLLLRIISEDKAEKEIPKPSFASYSEPKTVESNPVAIPSNFALQVGAFSSNNNAQRMIVQLNDKNIFNSSIQEEYQSNGKLLYKVIVKGYATRSGAQQELNMIKQKGFEGFIKKM